MGKCYLYRLKGEPIPLPARIFAVVDAFLKLLPASQPANDKVECDNYFLEKACRNKKYSENMPATNHSTHRTTFMISTATEADKARIHDITARAGVFNQEEHDSVPVMFDEYLQLGTDGKVRVEAWDLSGNVTKQE